MSGRRFTNKNQNSNTDPSDKQRQRKTPYPPPPPPVRNLTTEKNSLSTRKKPINDLSIIIIESKK